MKGEVFLKFLLKRLKVGMSFSFFFFFSVSRAFSSFSCLVEDPSARGDESLVRLEKRLEQLIKKSGIPKKKLSLVISETPNFGTRKKGDQEKKIENVKGQANQKRSLLSLNSNERAGKDVLVYRLNETQDFNPASLIKIVISGAVLAHLPLEHRFKTQLFAVKEEGEENVLNGSLYMKGGGDPVFTSESLWGLVNIFVRTNLTQIKGGIVVDDTLFDKERHSHRRSLRVQDSYDAPVGALSFNWNSVSVVVRPSKPKEPVFAFIDPNNEYIHLIQKAYTKTGSKNRLQVTRRKNRPPLRDSVLVKGFLGEKAKEKVFYRNITNPDIWTGYNLKSFLEQRKIKVEGEIVQGVTPPRATLLVEFESPPLKKSLGSMMKFSNNFVADMLTKNLAAHRGERPATLKTGLEVVREYLDGLFISRKHYRLKSASGLSEKNRFRVLDIHAVLNSMRDNFRLFPLFLGSLPVNGVDGTLKERINKRTDVKGWIRAKTGTLKNVTGLAGFAGSKKGRSLFTFAFLFNGSSSKKSQKMLWHAALLFDQLAESLVLADCY